MISSQRNRLPISEVSLHITFVTSETILAGMVGSNLCILQKISQAKGFGRKLPDLIPRSFRSQLSSPVGYQPSNITYSPSRTSSLVRSNNTSKASTWNFIDGACYDIYDNKQILLSVCLKASPSD